MEAPTILVVDDTPTNLEIVRSILKPLIAHSIKGSAANVSGLEVRDAARRMELTASAGDLAGAMSALPGLSESLERLRPLAEKFCREAPAGG